MPHDARTDVFNLLANALSPAGCADILQSSRRFRQPDCFSKEMDMEKDTAQSSRPSAEVAPCEDAAMQSRRHVLHGIVAATCALLVPVTFISATDASAATEPASKTRQVSKASVNYQSKPNGAKKCSGCANFIASSNTCKRVQGAVSPQGWCGLWTQKS